MRIVVAILASVLGSCDRGIVVGSKKFTESVVLAEIATQLASSVAANDVEHWAELGGTQVLWKGLLRGSIDIYPEYTGTLRAEILTAVDTSGVDALERALADRGVRATPALGFENTYAIGMRKERARELGVTKISDLARHPELRFGFGNEFLDRGDGWPGLSRTYDLRQTDVRGLDHDLAYTGLASGDIDVMDLYSTDAEIAYYDLRVLADDRSYFPEYAAVLLYRADLESREPEVVRALSRLGGTIDATAMIRLNERAKLEGEHEIAVAGDFLRERLSVATDAVPPGTMTLVLQHTGAHVSLVAISLFGAILLGVPLGVLAAKRRRLRQIVLASVSVLQTIPSLALLVMLIPLLGLGAAPAITALFLYSLLPIVRNTTTGLCDIPRPLYESALALGLPSRARLTRIELPLAIPTILAGIKTAAVINVGTATLGALIGAGGYGQPILTGIRRDDTGLILAGAIPAAILALLVQATFDWIERRLRAAIRSG